MTLLKIKKDIIPDSFERLVNNLLNETKSNGFEADESLPVFRPLTNLIEWDSNYEIQLALPGWDKKDIEISLDEGVLTVKGSKSDTTKKEHAWSRHEFSYGQFEKRFQLPKEARETINAELKNGVLHIVIEKSKKEETKKLIQVL